MNVRFGDRILGETYADDVLCEVCLVPDPEDKSHAPTSSWISERLLTRLGHLGLAYELPLLSRIPQNGKVTFPAVQAASLEDELEFLFDVITDEALLRSISPLREFVRVAKNDARGWVLTVETP